jgi:hypothetical protein
MAQHGGMSMIDAGQAPGAKEVLKLGGDVPDVVLFYILGAALLAVAWLAVKAAARRGVLVGAFERLDPTVQAVRVWVGRAPAVFTYVAIWTTTSVIQQGEPKLLADISARLASTNIHNLVQDPVRVLFASAFLVADYGFAYVAYIVIFAGVVARLEHRIGAARWLMVAVSAHVLGTLLTVVTEAKAIRLEAAGKTLVLTQDVGVSYVMVGSLGAYLWFVSRRWRWPYSAALAVGILGPLIAWHTIWDLGHFLATVVGVGAGLVAARYPVRPPLSFRELRSSAVPRALPTFAAESLRARGGTLGEPAEL